MNQVQNLLINLKVLSQIGPGDKINTKETHGIIAVSDRKEPMLAEEL